MVNISKNLNLILKRRKQKDRPISGQDVACAFAKLVISNPACTGIKVDTQVQLSKSLNVPVSVLHTAYSIMRSEYKLIYGWQGSGTFIVPVITKEHHSAIVKLIKKHSAPTEKVFFDREYLPAFNPALERDLLQAMSYHETISYKGLRLWSVPQLVHAFAEMMSEKMHYQFSKDEVLYTDDHNELITFCCELFCQKKSSILLLGAVCSSITDAMQGARRNITFLREADNTGMVAEIDLLFSSALPSIDIVYVGPSAPFSPSTYPDNVFWQRLLELQKIKHFKILLDDRYPQSVKVPNLFKEMPPQSNTGVISINTVSLHDQLAAAIVIAAPAADIKKLSRKYKNRLYLLPPALSYALLKLLEDHKLDQYEPKAFAHVEDVIAAAKTYLMSLDKLAGKYTLAHQGYFFQIELLSGSLPRNLSRKLSQQNIHIMQNKSLWPGADFSKSIFISVANYQNRKKVVKDLATLAKYL